MKKAQRDKPQTAILSQVTLPMNKHSLKECNKMNSELKEPFFNLFFFICQVAVGM